MVPRRSGSSADAGARDSTGGRRTTASWRRRTCPALLQLSATCGARARSCHVPHDDISFYLGRETLIVMPRRRRSRRTGASAVHRPGEASAGCSGMPHAGGQQLFVTDGQANAPARRTAFFQLPPNRVVELGAQMPVLSSRLLSLRTVSLSRATTLGSASVVVSPSARPSAMSLSSRRMILPLRVLGRSAEKRMSSGRAMAPIFLATCSLQLVLELRRSALCPSFRVTNAAIAWPLSSCGLAHHRRLRHRGVVHQRALDFHRADPVPGDVQHVVHPAQDPPVAVVVQLGAVAGEVAARETGSSRSPGSARRRRRWCAACRARAR